MGGVLDLFRLDGKIALVTGAAMGIGRGFAIALAQAGADVIVADLQIPAGERVAEEIQRLGRRSVFVHCDVSEQEQVERAVEVALSRFGKLDIGVNNAGVAGRSSRSEPPEGMTLEDWNSIMAVNLTGVFISCQAEARAMIQRKSGSIVNIASISGIIANANTAYSTAKAGVVMLTKRMAVMLGKYNINVNCISPTYMLTAMHSRTSEEMRKRIRSYHPMGWFGRPEDLQGSLVFLSSDAAKYLTGHNLVVDGGHTLTAWLEPIDRMIPPLVSPSAETVALKHDLDAMGMDCGDD